MDFFHLGPPARGYIPYPPARTHSNVAIHYKTPLLLFLVLKRGTLPPTTFSGLGPSVSGKVLCTAWGFFYPPSPLKCESYRGEIPLAPLDISGITGCPWGLWGLTRHRRDGVVSLQGAAIDAILCSVFRMAFLPAGSCCCGQSIPTLTSPFPAWYGVAILNLP